MTQPQETAPPDRPQPQPILGMPAHSAMFLVLTIAADTDAEDTVRDFLADLSGLRRSVGLRIPDGDLKCVVGIGSNAWDRLFAGPRPAELHPFKELFGAKHHAPSTPGDLLLHIRAKQMDLCFELATVITDRLAGAATVVDEVHGFKYFDQRDLMGFVDGTENPEGQDAVAAITITVEDDPDFAGASYVIVQKYLHDMRAWNALPVEAQEKVIGRTKLSDLELPDDVKPIDSHVALNTITDPDGTERDILRDNMPFGTVGNGEFGTYFIGYSSTPSVTEQMLRNMFIGKPPGTYDRILDFSTAITGNLFFVPTADFLEDPPGPPKASGAASVPAGGDLPADPVVLPAPASPAAASVASGASDGSLGIGGLSRRS
ncbi:Dyp-type peroxidase [Embleya sp. NBC_00896]|uniref:Dyp-type peroxidase n=1 Tax=Embleya sp. NBC_00896 TaxID=2975961 RepID=UPI003868309D|nr:Dyp-type peroxidase [Embleya sp. NBC_00896]